MEWNNLVEDAQRTILSHARHPTVAVKVCLRDEYKFHEHDQVLCVQFLDVEGIWLCDGSFACNLDEDRIPTWDEESSTIIEHWMEFRLRRKQSGALVLPNGEDDGKWIEVGRLQKLCVPKHSWHGVMKQASTTNPYNCRLFCGHRINAGSDEDNSPGYTIELLPSECVTHNARLSNDDPFTAIFEHTP